MYWIFWAFLYSFQSFKTVYILDLYIIIVRVLLTFLYLNELIFKLKQKQFC